MIVTGFHVFGECTLFNVIGHYLHEKALDKDPIDRYDDVVIMQFTGLLDNNKKEIYEGDIVRYAYDWDYSDKEMKVRVFKKGKKASYIGRVDWEGDEYAHFVVNPYRINLAPAMHLTEIIGNIYENPELLANTIPPNKYKSCPPHTNKS